MFRRIALMLRVLPLEAEEQGATRGVLCVSDVTSEQELPVRAVSFILTLEHESGAPVARGHLQSTLDHTRYAVQGQAGLFEVLAHYIDASGSAQ
jgi:hypothetical protein